MEDREQVVVRIGVGAGANRLEGEVAVHLALKVDRALHRLELQIDANLGQHLLHQRPFVLGEGRGVGVLIHKGQALDPGGVQQLARLGWVRGVKLLRLGLGQRPVTEAERQEGARPHAVSAEREIQNLLPVEREVDRLPHTDIAQLRHPLRTEVIDLVRAAQLGEILESWLWWTS